MLNRLSFVTRNGKLLSTHKGFGYAISLLEVLDPRTKFQSDEMEYPIKVLVMGINETVMVNLEQPVPDNWEENDLVDFEDAQVDITPQFSGSGNFTKKYLEIRFNAKKCVLKKNMKTDNRVTTPTK